MTMNKNQEKANSNQLTVGQYVMLNMPPRKLWYPTVVINMCARAQSWVTQLVSM